jgi:hypothetical protein
LANHGRDLEAVVLFAVGQKGGGNIGVHVHVVKVAWQGLGEVRVAQSVDELVGPVEAGDGSRLISPRVVLLVDGLRDESTGSGPVGLRQPCAVECPMGMGLRSIPERAAGMVPSRVSQAVWAGGGVPLALQQKVCERLRRA